MKKKIGNLNGKTLILGGESNKLEKLNALKPNEILASVNLDGTISLETRDKVLTGNGQENSDVLNSFILYFTEMSGFPQGGLPKIPIENVLNPEYVTYNGNEYPILDIQLCAFTNETLFRVIDAVNNRFGTVRSAQNSVNHDGMNIRLSKDSMKSLFLWGTCYKYSSGVITTVNGDINIFDGPDKNAILAVSSSIDQSSSEFTFVYSHLKDVQYARNPGGGASWNLPKHYIYFPFVRYTVTNEKL